MKDIIKKINKKLTVAYCFVLTLFLQADVAFGMDLLNNPIVQGSVKLLKDASKTIMIVSSVAVLPVVGFFQLKKKFLDDEMEMKQCDKRSKGAVITWIIIMSAGVILSTVASYYQIDTSGIPS